ncbi:hypothetical protein V6N11_017788 [Hibiscus sabdariffa]|uniref:Uncharacterized protein n=1 Tax=Hibiscus sabdariffa TaxID=183260 RepID=A0ABR2TZD8_9ROSI
MSACLWAAWLTGGCCASRESDWPPLGGVLQVRFRWPYRAVTPLVVRQDTGLAWLGCPQGLAAVTDVYFEQSPKTTTVGSHPWRTKPLSSCLRPTLGLLGAVSAAWFVLPPQAALAATVGSNPRALLVPNSPFLCLSSWLLDSPLCGAGLALLALSSLCLCLALWLPDGPLCNAGFVARLRVRFAACFVEWMTLERFGSMTWPRYRFMTCSASLLLVLWFTCPRSTTGLLTGSVCCADLTARPFRWPILGVGFAACPVAWPLVVERLLGAAPVVAAGTSFSCCSSFHPPWRASLLLVLWFTCPRSTTGLLAGSVCGADLMARPFRWPILGVGFAACPDAWLLVAEWLIGAVPFVVVGTSFSCCSSFHPLWRASLLLALWFTCPYTTTGLLAGFVCGTVLPAWPHRWPVLGVGFATCPAAWLLLLERTNVLKRGPWDF